MAEIKDEYIQWPGPATFPGVTTTPAYDRYANGNTLVHSHKGWEWQEVDSPYQKAAAALAQSAIETAVQRASTVFGTVYYQRGNSTDRPDFDGKAIGDTCRIQDPQTLNIVAEWRWNGSDWEKMQVSGEQVSNLDVGRLTAGSAAINELAARKIAADTGQFLQLTTDQLTVTGNASFVDATARHVWAKIVSANEGEFQKIRAGMIAANAISADNLQVGALDGKVITGATIQTERAANRGLKISSAGMQVYASNGWKALDINAQTGEIDISGRLGRQDSWSKVWFNDIVSRDSGSDTHEGEKYGCGLSFNSLEDDWYDGTISLRKASTGDPALRIQGPMPKRSGNVSPYITVGTSAIAMYTPAGNGSLSFNAQGMNLQASDVYWWMNGAGFSYGTKKDNTPRFYLDNSFLDIKPFRSTATSGARIWADGSKIAMQFNQANQVWISSEGVHLTGNKQFAMRVPKATRARGGMWLTHSCTESPYDGLEYWENVTIDESGHATWALPDYVPLIASAKAPWAVFASDGARAELDRSDPEEWRVNIAGTPGSTVAVLVKGARMIDHDTDESGEPIMRDYARESMWILPPSSGALQGGGPEEGEEGNIAYEDPVTLGGNYYGPAPDPSLESN
jgi:hypothetical protein|nr:MAG TPA: hypothetical protein [Caudoviricetes sp.]